MSDNLIETVAELPKLCEYLHFPVQSGSSAVLRKMRRGYSREDYLDRIATIRRLIPDVALSSDFIVGFPGETERDHQDSVSLIESIHYDNIFIFNYNVRPGTRAADYPDDVPWSVKNRRLEDLLQRQRRISMERNQNLIGATVEVMVDGPAKRGGSLWTGRTRQNRDSELQRGCRRRLDLSGSDRVRQSQLSLRQDHLTVPELIAGKS